MKDIYYDIKGFFRAVWKFRKELAKYRNWDYYYGLKLYSATLIDLADAIEKYSSEIEEDKLLKTRDMRRLNVLLNAVLEDEYLEKCGFDSSVPFYSHKTKGNSVALEKARLLKEEDLKELSELFIKFEEWWY